LRFDIPTRANPNINKYPKDELDIAREFSRKIYHEFGNFLKGVVVFGSTAREKRPEKGDIDILVIVDDLALSLTPEIVEAYRIITEKTIANTSTKLHVITLKFTAFWEYVRNGDPVAVNILRDGIALIDSGFFDPLQALLKMGRIRPTPESIYTYFARAPRTLYNSKWHLMQATLDLYWSVIDSAHAALMKMGEIPPSPDHIADMLQERLVAEGLLEQGYVSIMRNFYRTMKMITHREVKEISGEEYERYFKEAEDFVSRMQKIVEK